MKRYILIASIGYCISTLDLIYTKPEHSTEKAYTKTIEVNDDEDLDETQPLRKAKKRLYVDYLRVNNSLSVKGYPITPATLTSFSASYGQLSITSQATTFEVANTWITIPFNGSCPSSNVNVSTTSPATITIQSNGTYQTNCSLYFSTENSDEGIFTPTTYTLGFYLNGVTSPVAAIFAGDPGNYTLNFSKIMQLSVNDSIRFYIQVSDTEPSIFSNNVTFEAGNASLVQISS